MRILIAFPSVRDFGPPGLCHTLAPYQIAGFLRALGHDVAVMPPGLKDRFLDQEMAAKWVDSRDLLMISSNTFNWPVAKGFIEHAKCARPDLPIVCGGIHPTSFPEHVLASTKADYVVQGEAEPVVAGLIAGLKEGAREIHIDNVSYRTGDKIRSLPYKPLPFGYNQVPLPAYDLVESGAYTMLPFETSRGCPNKCAFCSILNKHRWRCLSTDLVLKRLKSAMFFLDRYKSFAILTTDDCFTANPKRCMELCEALLGQRFNLSWLLEARVEDLLFPGIMEHISQMDSYRLILGSSYFTRRSSLSFPQNLQLLERHTN